MSDAAVPRRSGTKIIAAIGGFLVGVAAILGVLVSLGIIDPQVDVVIVQDVTGQDAAAAEQALREDGHPVEVTRIANASVTKGLVITTAPSPGAEIKEGDPIKLFVSSGPPNGGGTLVTIPDLVGQEPSDALLVLGAFEVTVREEFSAEVGQGLVIDTDPSHGSRVPYGSKVEIIVSKGPAAPLVDLAIDVDPTCSLVPNITFDPGDTTFPGFSPGQVAANPDLTFTFRVMSLGEPVSDPITVSVVGDIGSETVSVETMDTTESVTFPVAEYMGGDHVVTFTIDPNAVDEGGATDNNSEQVTAFLSRGLVPDPCAPDA